MLSFWSSSTFRLQIDTDDYEVFVGRNVTAVHRLHDNHKATWLPTGLPWKTKDVKLNPFERSCVGILTKEKYSVTLLMYRVNYWLVLVTAVGIAAFIYAPRLCRNVFFHYMTGIGAGIALSLLVATYFLQRRLRTGWFGWIMACYSLYLLPHVAVAQCEALPLGEPRLCFWLLRRHWSRQLCHLLQE